MLCSETLQIPSQYEPVLLTNCIQLHPAIGICVIVLTVSQPLDAIVKHPASCSNKDSTPPPSSD